MRAQMRDDTPRERLRQARTLRQEMTIAEAILWKHLRGRGLLGMKFRRQVPIGPYIADFACVSERLIIELDGPPHENAERRERDQKRDDWFLSNGWRVLRLSNERVIGGAALDDISRVLDEPSSDPASPGHLLP
ncbi:MAG: endonuclease domain-containing protein [Methylocystis sp.]